jgi:hypothetical protein
VCRVRDKGCPLKTKLEQAYVARYGAVIGGWIPAERSIRSLLLSGFVRSIAFAQHALSDLDKMIVGVLHKKPKSVKPLLSCSAVPRHTQTFPALSGPDW